MALLLHVDDARIELLTILEEEYISHPGLRALLAALRQAPSAAPESLMPSLASDAERELMASLLVLERNWSDAEKMISAERIRRAETFARENGVGFVRKSAGLTASQFLKDLGLLT